MNTRIYPPIFGVIFFLIEMKKRWDKGSRHIQWAIGTCKG